LRNCNVRASIAGLLALTSPFYAKGQPQINASLAPDGEVFDQGHQFTQQEQASPDPENETVKDKESDDQPK